MQNLTLNSILIELFCQGLPPGGQQLLFRNSVRFGEFLMNFYKEIVVRIRLTDAD